MASASTARRSPGAARTADTAPLREARRGGVLGLPDLRHPADDEADRHDRDSAAPGRAG